MAAGWIACVAGGMLGEGETLANKQRSREGNGLRRRFCRLQARGFYQVTSESIEPATKLFDCFSNLSIPQINSVKIVYFSIACCEFGNKDLYIRV